MTSEEAKAYGARRANALMSALEKVIEMHPEIQEVQDMEEAWGHIKSPFLRVVERQETSRFDRLTEFLAVTKHEWWTEWNLEFFESLGEVIGLGFYEARDNNLNTDGITRARAAMVAWKEKADLSFEELSSSDQSKYREIARQILESLETF